MNVNGQGEGVISAGRLYCDLVFSGMPRMPSLGTEVFADGLTLHAGGGALITAAYLSALDRPVSLLAQIPGAPFDGLVRQEIAAAHVSSDLCRPAAPGADPQITVVMSGARDRAFLTRRSGPALPPMSDAAFDSVGARHLHIGELTTLVEHPGLLDAARARGMSISLDCGWDDAQDLAGAAALIAQVDVFLPNAAEYRQLIEAGLPPIPAPVTVIKQGAEGAELRRADGPTLRAPAAASVSVVDTTGAGDAFNGGFLNAWLKGAGPAQCLAAGNRCGASAVRYAGGVAGALALRNAARVPSAELSAGA